MIVVDSSALIAVALKEVEGPAFRAALASASSAQLSQINFAETGMVLVQRGFIARRADLEEFLHDYDVEVRDEPLLGQGALDAFLHYGKGRHPARLNLGDCFAYALAKALDAPLLYKGDDFSKTDIRSAL